MLDSVSKVPLTSRQPAPSPSAGPSSAPRCAAGPAAGPRLRDPRRPRGLSSPLPPPHPSPAAPSPPAVPGFVVSPERAPEGQTQCKQIEFNCMCKTQHSAKGQEDGKKRKDSYDP